MFMTKETIFSFLSLHVFTVKFEYDFFGHRLLYRLIQILNARERKLDEVIDSKINTKFKFSLTDNITINALLNNLYSSLNLSSIQKKLRKYKVTYQELIIAVLYGYECQDRLFEV